MVSLLPDRCGFKVKESVDRVVDVIGVLCEADLFERKQETVPSDVETTPQVQVTQSGDVDDVPEIIYGSPEAIKYFEKAVVPQDGATIEVGDLSARSKLVVRPLSSPETYTNRPPKVLRTNLSLALAPTQAEAVIEAITKPPVVERSISETQIELQYVPDGSKPIEEVIIPKSEEQVTEAVGEGPVRNLSRSESMKTESEILSDHEADLESDLVVGTRAESELAAADPSESSSEQISIIEVAKRERTQSAENFETPDFPEQTLEEQEPKGTLVSESEQTNSESLTVEEAEEDDDYTPEEDLVNKRAAARVASLLNDVHRPLAHENLLDDHAERLAEAIVASAMFETVFLKARDDDEEIVESDDEASGASTPNTQIPRSVSPCSTIQPDVQFIGSSLCRLRFPYPGT